MRFLISINTSMRLLPVIEYPLRISTFPPFADEVQSECSEFNCKNH
jgi:hypothetical protein